MVDSLFGSVPSNSLPGLKNPAGGGVGGGAPHAATLHLSHAYVSTLLLWMLVVGHTAHGAELRERLSALAAAGP